MRDDVLVELADGTHALKPFAELQSDDMVVFDGPDAFADLDAAQKKLDDEIEQAGGLARWREEYRYRYS